MSKQVLLIALMAVLASGCQSGSSAMDQAATMVAGTIAAAPPTETLAPTSTSLPIKTSAPKPTATANVALTATVEAYKVLSELDVHVGENSDIPYEEFHL